MNIYFAELAMSGVYHSNGNSSFIKLLKQVYPETKNIYLLAEKKHAETCLQILKDSNLNIKVKPFFYFPKVSLKTLVLRDFIGTLYAIKIMICANKKDLIFFAYALPFTHIAITLLNKLYRKTVFIGLHGQLEALLPNTPLGLTKYYFSLEKRFFKNDKYCYYVLLGEVIYNQISFIFSEKSKVIVVDLPYHDIAVASFPNFSYPIKMGQIGVGDLSKGTPAIFSLAENLKKYIASGQLELNIVGMLKPELYSYKNELVTYFSEPLNADEYSKEIEKLHYSLVFRGKSQGLGLASGSFFDTIKYCKPFLSLNSMYVEYYSNKFPGCGEIFNSLELLTQKIEWIINNVGAAEAEHKNQIQELKVMNAAFSLSSIAEKFRTQL